MKLYGSMASPYVARVVMCARAKGLDLKPELPPGGLKSADYLRMNPLGKMPVLDVDGACVAESEVICEYLEDAFPERTLRPSNPLDRARARLISRTFDLYVMSQSGVLFRQFNPATRNQAEVDAAVGTLQKGLAHVEHFLGPGPYAVGKTLTSADCTLLPDIAFLGIGLLPPFGVKSPVDTLPRIGAWWSQMGEDPLCVQVLEEFTVAYQQFMQARLAKARGG
ncbi:MAG TPA: glutathione S-transferase family protein [Steroidobacteraceae bacterium]|nr:glutathione S-transferase family protein [Steroidobacteraceae bacterium]